MATVTRRKAWTPGQEKALRLAIKQRKTVGQIGRIVGNRTPGAVRQKIFSLGLQLKTGTQGKHTGGTLRRGTSKRTTSRSRIGHRRG